MVRPATTIPTRLDAQASTVLWLYWQEPRPLKRLCYLHPLSPRKTQSSFTTLIAYFDIDERSGRCEPVSLIQNSQGSAEIRALIRPMVYCPAAFSMPSRIPGRILMCIRTILMVRIHLPPPRISDKWWLTNTFPILGGDLP